MPARKPSGLIQRNETAAEKRARVAREEALRPERGVPANPPASLKGHRVAGRMWRRLMRLYGELDAEIVTRLDMDILAEYCLVSEQIGELDEIRRTILEGDTENVNLELFVKVDARADRKRAHLMQLRQSLYLTPRARAGAIPAHKEKEPPPDELEMLLNDVTDFVNNGEGKQ